MSGNADLFAIIRVIDESSLLERLKQLGADVYCEGNFPTLAERLRHVILREQMAKTVSGRDPHGKVETLEQAFLRVTGETLILKRTRTSNDSQYNKEG